MKTTIDRILSELYRIDPALREQEDALKKAIQKLMDEKPDARMDSAFEKELRDKLLAAFPSTQAKKRSLFMNIVTSSAFRRGAGLATAACLVLFVALQFRVDLKTGPGMPPEQYDSKNIEPSTVAQAPLVSRKTQTEPLAKPTPLPTKPKADEKARASNEMQAPSAVPSAGAPAAIMDELFAVSRDSDAGSEPELEKGVYRKEAKTALGELNAYAPNPEFNTEGYDRITENSFAETLKEPLSTFSIDVDTASYTNVRRFLNSGSLPYPDAVRIEEMINYFDYEYAGPSGDDPINLETELSRCPWNDEHLLLRVGLQARRVAQKDLPPGNLVFLIDVSGSMSDANKLPLVKESMKLLVANMRQQDRIAIVVYSGSAGLVLPSTSGDRKDIIVAAIDRLESGGSTAGGEGIMLAYKTAKEAYMARGNNRVIIASDGDFNVGPSSDGELVRMIEEKRKEGVFLTVLGFGMGNYKDSKMQGLADSGNGNYAYIDSLAEAQKALVKQMAGTLFTIAKDVKIQIEFNPAVVGEYRLLGYENRMLAARDFADDTKDAGELGAGTSVTALYELIPAGTRSSRGDLRYQNSTVSPTATVKNELMLIKFRYKKPDGDTSLLLERQVAFVIGDLNKTSDNFRFAAAVAEWGLLLRSSEFKGSASFAQVEELARGARGSDQEGWRAEFIRLVGLSASLSR